MVRKIDISATIGGCTAATLWKAVYADPVPTVLYHARVNEDPAADVGAWKEGVRHVCFTMPLAAPDWVKRTVNIESISVRETQMVLWNSSHSFTVRSETTVLNVPGAARFQTSLSLAITERSEGGTVGGAGARGALGAGASEGAGGALDVADAACDVMFTVRCSAGMPWPLSGSIENIMAEKAQASMQGYLSYCQDLVDSAAQAAADQGATEAGAAAAGGATDAAGAAGAAGAPGVQRRMSHTSAGADGTERLPSRAFRWPSVAVSTFPQGMDELLPALPEGEALTPGEGTSPGAAAGAAHEASFQDAADTWLSPAPSFSPSGYTSDDGGHTAAHSVIQRTRGRSLATHPTDTSSAAVVVAVQGLAAAIQALDKKVQFITTHLPTSPAAARANKRAWGSGGSPKAAGSSGLTRGAGDPLGRYHALPGHDIESGAAGGATTASRGWCPSVWCCMRTTWLAVRLLCVVLMVAGAYYVFLMARGQGPRAALPMGQ